MGVSRLYGLLVVALLVQNALAGSIRKLLDDPACNPCYSPDKSEFICCSGGTCGLQGNVPTCSGGQPVYGSTPGAIYTYFAAGQMCPDPATSPNPCYAADGTSFTCCAGTCGPFSGNFPTCVGGAPPSSPPLNQPAGAPPATASPPAATSPVGTPAPPVGTAAPPVGTSAPPASTLAPPVTTSAPPAETSPPPKTTQVPGSEEPGSTPIPMTNGMCRPGLNPCYVADGSYGYCCGTTCAPNGMTPACTGGTNGGAPVTPNPTPAPTAPVSTPAPTSPSGTISPDFTPGLVSPAGSFAMLNPDVGISAMHGTPVPYTNKLLFIDRTDVGASKLFLPDGSYAYAGEYDLGSNTIRAISVASNTWCSAGAYMPDGTIMNNGGGDGGGGFAANAGIRLFNDGGNLVFAAQMLATRWYPTAHNLPDGRVLIVGGDDLTGTAPNADQASYEFYPSDGQLHPLALLARPNVVAAHMYPFLHLIPDGRMFVFAAQSSVLLDYKTGSTVDLPDLAGNLRQYPQAGASILLPLDYIDNYTPRVMVCGGGNTASEPSAPASSSCGTIDLSAANPNWRMSSTPSPRVMGYLVYLLDGTCLYIGGAFDGYSGYYSSNTPNYQPSIYDPTHDTWQQVTAQANIPRLYHSTHYLIPDGRVIVHGGNPRPNYDFFAPEPQTTQTSVEAFSPWYVGAPGRPSITALQSGASLGGTFAVSISVGGASIDPAKIRVALINPGFATHTLTMNQRYVRLALVSADGNGLTVSLPSNAAVLPPGPYLCTVLYQGVPSEAQWFTVRA